MNSQVIFKLAFGAAALFSIGSIAYAQRIAQRKHGSRFAQCMNEVPGLLWVRGLLAIPVYAGLIDWLLSTHWFPWAIVPLPPWARWAGVLLAAIVTALFWWSHLALGSNYRGAMGLHEHHELITHGPYRFVRHPTYVAFPLLIVAIFLLSANWLIGLPGLILVSTMGLVRAPIEEHQLLDRFGDKYTAYVRRTGHFSPRIW